MTLSSHPEAIRSRKRSAESQEYREYHKQYQRKNLKRLRTYHKRWRAAHPESINRYMRNRRRDPIVRLVDQLRLDIWKALKKKGEKGRSIRLLGCSIENFRIYLESKFEPGMSWDNYGYRGWHVDHIMPCAIFDMTKPEHQKRCFHFSNLQPMWAVENQRKGKKVHVNKPDDPVPTTETK